jgi:hypothetical protein
VKTGCVMVTTLDQVTIGPGTSINGPERNDQAATSSSG